MSKKQTRRSISVAGSTYDALKTYCDARHLSLSGLVESLSRVHLGLEDKGPRAKQGAPKPRPVVAAPAVVDTTLAVPVVAPVVIDFVPNKEKVIAREIKKPGTPLEDIASKIFTF